MACLFPFHFCKHHCTLSHSLLLEAIKILRLQFKQGAQIRQSRLHGKVQQEIQDYVKRVLLSQIEYYIKLYNESNWLTLRSDTIILFLDIRKQNIDMQEFCKHILDIFSKKQNLSISIGVSNSFDQETNIPEAYHQAFQSASALLRNPSCR